MNSRSAKPMPWSDVRSVIFIVVYKLLVGDTKLYIIIYISNYIIVYTFTYVVLIVIVLCALERG